MQKTKNLSWRFRRQVAFVLALIMCLSLNAVQNVQTTYAAFPDVNGIEAYRYTSLPRQASMNSCWINNYKKSNDYRYFMSITSEYDNKQYHGSWLNLQPGVRYKGKVMCYNFGAEDAKNVRLSLTMPDEVEPEPLLNYEWKITAAVTCSNANQKKVENYIAAGPTIPNGTVKIVPVKNSVKYRTVNNKTGKRTNKYVVLKDSEVFSEKGAKVGSLTNDGVIFGRNHKSSNSAKKTILGEYGVTVEFEFDVVSADSSKQTKPKSLKAVNTPTPISPYTGKTYNFDHENAMWVEKTVFKPDGTPFEYLDDNPDKLQKVKISKEGTYYCEFYFESFTELKDVRLNMIDHSGFYKAGDQSNNRVFNVDATASSNKAKKEFRNAEQHGGTYVNVWFAKDMRVDYGETSTLTTEDGKVYEFPTAFCFDYSGSRGNVEQAYYPLRIGADMDGFMREGEKFTITVPIVCVFPENYVEKEYEGEG